MLKTNETITTTMETVTGITDIKVVFSKMSRVSTKFKRPENIYLATKEEIQPDLESPLSFMVETVKLNPKGNYKKYVKTLKIKDFFQYKRNIDGSVEKNENGFSSLLLSCDSYQRAFYKNDKPFINGVIASLILSEGVSGTFQFSIRNNSIFIVDGQQRTMTIFGFLNDDIVFDLSKVNKEMYTKEQINSLKAYDQKTFSQMCAENKTLKEDILSTEVACFIYLYATRELEVMMYKRMNSNTKKVSELEILRADYAEHITYIAAEAIADIPRYQNLLKCAGKKEAGNYTQYVLELMALYYLGNESPKNMLSVDNMTNVKAMLDGIAGMAIDEKGNIDVAMMEFETTCIVEEVCSLFDFIINNNLTEALNNAGLEGSGAKAKSKKFSTRVLFFYLLFNKDSIIVKENLVGEALYQLYNSENFKLHYEKLINNGTGKIGNVVLVEDVWKGFFEKLAKKYLNELKTSPDKIIKTGFRFEARKKNKHEELKCER